MLNKSPSPKNKKTQPLPFYKSQHFWLFCLLADHVLFQIITNRSMAYQKRWSLSSVGSVLEQVG